MASGAQMTRPSIRREGEKISLDIKALPGASKTEFAGPQEGRLRIRIAAAPEDGKANAELIAFLAKALGLAKREIVLVRGEKSRLKTLAFPAACGERLEALLTQGAL
jgi:uncharacterized protein (TIGR00251 family)